MSEIVKNAIVTNLEDFECNCKNIENVEPQSNDRIESTEETHHWPRQREMLLKIVRPKEQVNEQEESCACAQLAEAARLGQVNRAMETFLKQCVQHHQELIGISERIQSIYGTSLAFRILIIIICSIFALYVSVIHGSFDPNAGAMFVVLGGFIMSGFLVCWYAEKLTEESSKIDFSVYCCDWLTAREGFKRSMMIMIARSEKPVVLRGMGIPLSLRTFRAVSKAAYYLYTYLIKVYLGLKLINKS